MTKRVYRIASPTGNPTGNPTTETRIIHIIRDCNRDMAPEHGRANNPIPRGWYRIPYPECNGPSPSATRHAPYGVMTYHERNRLIANRT